MSPSYFKSISPSISFHASHPSLALSAASTSLLHCSVCVCVCVYVYVCVLFLGASIYVCLSLSCFLYLCVCVCVADADETVIHDLLRVFLSEDIRSSTASSQAQTHICRQTHTCRQTPRDTHTHTHTHIYIYIYIHMASEEIRESLKVEISFGAWLLLSCRSCD